MISPEILAGVAELAARDGVSEATVARLRQAWPGVHFTCCSEDDVPARLKPVAEGPGFGLYLVSNAEHCVAFTDHLQAASGLVLAEVSED